ncbi:MAG TPA: hypothetical protein VK989_07855 [Polyangia bacterium]|nr:hypothetical protein [Polyangia bacterium]
MLEPALTPDAAANGDAGASGGNGAGGHMNGDAGADGGAGNGGNAGSSGNRTDGGRADGAFCAGGQIQQLNFMMRTPDVVFSVDRSAGMQTWFGTGSRLQVIQDQIDALVAKYQKLVRFGYEEFPSSAGMGMCSGGQGCCAGAVIVPPTENALKFIDNVRTSCTTTAGTAGMGGGSSGGPPSGCASQTSRPTADALSKCEKTFATLAAFPTSGDRYVILMTGGEPSCLISDPTSTPCGDAVNAVIKLKNNDSVGTAVFGVGEEAMGSACLDQLALAGGLESGGASPYFHLALTPTALTAALSPVVETIAEQACQIDVLRPPADPTKVSLLFDGVAVVQDGVDGWDFDAGSTVKITIHGAACATLLQDAPHVDLVSGCTPPHH